MTTITEGPRTETTPSTSRRSSVLPGLALCAAAVVVALTGHRLVAGLSPLIIAIVLGIGLANTVGVPDAARPGIAVAAKRLLRLGIVFLGLRLVVSDIAGLGVPMLLVVVAVVTGGIFGTIAMGRAMGMPAQQVLLIACGFSICGAAAVAGVEGVTDAEEEDVITAVALVVVFGTLMIPLIPLLGSLVGLDEEHRGLWAGASIHEIAQVVAAGGVIGGGALTVAVLTKLARILMLAPVVTVLSIRQRRLDTTRIEDGAETRRPPLVPLFVIGFLAMVGLRSTVHLPESAMAAGDLAQNALLAAAMFGLGCGVRIRELVKVGARPFVLATASTALVAGIALAGIELIVLAG